MLDPRLLEYATPRQREIAEAVISTGSTRQAAIKLGINHRNVSHALARIRLNAARAGLSPEHDLEHTVPDGYRLKGASTLYKDGQPVLQWVKSERDTQRIEEIAREIAAGFLDDLRGLSKSTKAPRTVKHSLTVYGIGDAHVGMYAWGEEAGEDFDLSIAEADLCAAIARLVDAAPPSETALIAQVGDFIHIDDTSNATPASKNALDADGRYLKVLRTGVRILRFVIDRALQKHKRVIVRNVGGNHDPHSSVALTLALEGYYCKNKRVEVADSPKPFWWMEFGNNLVGLTHGHGKQFGKPENMAGALALEASEAWHKPFKYVYHGHIHQRRQVEHLGVVVECFRTLAARDAWHASEGYKSGREMVCIVLDKDHGEVERHTCGISRARAA